MKITKRKGTRKANIKKISKLIIKCKQKNKRRSTRVSLYILGSLMWDNIIRMSKISFCLGMYSLLPSLVLDMCSKQPREYP